MEEWKWPFYEQVVKLTSFALWIRIFIVKQCDVGLVNKTNLFLNSLKLN